MTLTSARRGSSRHSITPGRIAGNRSTSHTHAAQFLICRTCGRVVEMQDHAVSSVLARAAKEAGFTINAATIEAEGLCSTCRAVPQTRSRSSRMAG